MSLYEDLKKNLGEAGAMSFAAAYEKLPMTTTMPLGAMGLSGDDVIYDLSRKGSMFTLSIKALTKKAKTVFAGLEMADHQEFFVNPTSGQEWVALAKKMGVDPKSITMEINSGEVVGDKLIIEFGFYEGGANESQRQRRADLGESDDDINGFDAWSQTKAAKFSYEAQFAKFLIFRKKSPKDVKASGGLSDTFARLADYAGKELNMDEVEREYEHQRKAR